MNALETKTINYLIERWNENFTGTSALDISEKLDISHKNILKVLRKMYKENHIRFIETQLTSIKIDEEGKTILSKNIDTLIATPTRKILTDNFIKNNKDFGVFTNRLHKGDSQITYYFFKYDVLNKYLQYKDRYELINDSFGGYINLKNEYYLQEENNNINTFSLIKFGKYKTDNNEWGIGVIAKDLDISIAEQYYWASYEIKEPKFNKEDITWDKYIKQNYLGDWEILQKELIQELKQTLQKINLKIGKKLFIQVENPNLFIPVINTVASYRDANEELYKLIGEDNIEEITLKNLLITKNFSEKDFYNANSRKSKGKWNLITLLFKHVEISFEPFERVKASRIEKTHKITKETLPQKYYPEEFELNINGIIKNIKALTEVI